MIKVNLIPMKEALETSGGNKIYKKSLLFITKEIWVEPSESGKY